MDKETTYSPEVTYSDRYQSVAKSIDLIYYLTGFIESLLLFRLIFRAFGANPGSPFVSLIYSISNVFISPFIGIFPSTASGRSVIEPSVLVAMLVYLILAKGVVELIKISATKRQLTDED